MTADTAKKADVLPADTAGALKQENAQVNADVNLWQPVIKELSASIAPRIVLIALFGVFSLWVFGWFHCFAHPLCMAYYSNDGKFLPQESEG